MDYSNNSPNLNTEGQLENKDHTENSSVRSRRNRLSTRPFHHSRQSESTYPNAFASPHPYATPHIFLNVDPLNRRVQTRHAYDASAHLQQPLSNPRSSVAGDINDLQYRNGPGQIPGYYCSASMDPLEAFVPINVSDTFNPEQFGMISGSPSTSYASPQTSRYSLDMHSFPASTPNTASSLHFADPPSSVYPPETGKSLYGLSQQWTPYSGRDNTAQGFNHAYSSTSSASNNLRPQTAPSNHSLEPQGSTPAYKLTSDPVLSNRSGEMFSSQAYNAPASQDASSHMLQPPRGPIRSGSRKKKSYSPCGSMSRSRSRSVGSVHGVDTSENGVVKCQCGIRFGLKPKSKDKSARSNLKRHIDEQNNKGRFRCLFHGCGYKSARQENLNSHQEKRNHKH